jgi:4-amino-4-deoxy-L-arabinose transferase-like glycosyltransferase
VLWRAAFVLATLALVAATVALRLYHQTTAYEVSMDEIQYADVANSFAAGLGPRLFGDPFFLHPPLFFAMLGATISTPAAPMTLPFVISLRWFEVVFACANVALVVAVTRRITGRKAALVAGVLYALDPFVVRFDSRLFLEAPTMTFILGGLLALAVAVERSGQVRTGLLLAGGVLFGAAVTTKSTAALVTAVPLLIMFATGWVLRRREAFGVLAAQCGVYGLYVAVVAASGSFAVWYDQTLGGVFRAIGVHAVTGFNAKGAPSFLARLSANATLFTPSYLLIALAAGFVGWQVLRLGLAVARRRAVVVRPVAALFLVWLSGIFAAVAYTFAFAEIEEQTFYLLAVPATIVVAAMTARGTLPWKARAIVLGAVPALAVSAAAVWVGVHTVRDDAYLQMEQYLATRAEKGTALALGEYTAQFVSPGYVILPITQAGYARYALVSTQLSALGLAPVTSEGIDDLLAAHPIAFEADGRTSGRLILFDLDARR